MPFIYGYMLRVFYTPKPHTISFLIHLFSKTIKNLTVIQVGANDGFNNDPIVKFILRDSWKGILIEPQKYIYCKYLEPLHAKSKNIQTIHAAIGYDDGILPLYKLSFCDDRWASGLATFNKEVLENMVLDGSIERKAARYGIRVPKLQADYISKEDVPVLSPQTLKESYRIHAVDFLMIDTEGFDLEIVKMFLKASCEPSVIVFEHFHLSKEELLECEVLLRTYNYVFIRRGGNTFSIKNSPQFSTIHTYISHM